MCVGMRRWEGDVCSGVMCVCVSGCALVLRAVSLVGGTAAAGE